MLDFFQFLYPSEIQERLAKLAWEQLEEPDQAGAFDPVFQRPELRAFYLIHWALIQFAGTFTLLGLGMSVVSHMLRLR